MRRPVRVLVLALGIAACRGKSPPKPTAPDDAARPADAMRVTGDIERDRLFLSVPTAQAVAGIIERLAPKPHVAGTPENEQVAKEIMRTLGRMGWKLGTTQYGVYLPHPKQLSITVFGDKPFTIATTEPAAARYGDAPVHLAWNAYAASGTVKAPLVYASYGRAEDLAAVKQAGVSVKGKILLLRHGSMYRGAQVASAERAGAVGVIFYSDPEDEPARPRDSVERGTVAYYWRYPGDPLTPGVAATKDAARQPRETATVLPKIPVVTVTAVEAERLLGQLTGPAAPPELAGGLPRYRLGAGPLVELAVELDGETRVVRNVVAILDGKSPQAIVLGNHYDAWGPGAVDPHSGTAALIEIARGLAALGKAGWRPQRTIILAFWDAEEFGMVGSTEWVEDQLPMLDPNAIAYFNIDAVKAGPLVVNGSPALRELVRSCAHDVDEPATGAPFAPTFGDLGIGSDFTAFLHHAGIASLQWQSGAGPGTYDVWHSMLDDLEHARIADPGFVAIPAFARVMGLCAIRLADADYLPLRYSETATWLEAAIAQLEGTGTKLDRTKLDPALAALREAALHAETMPMKAGGDPTTCNAALVVAERGFLAPDGGVDRPWYRHLAIGPDPATGYGALLLPELAAARDPRALARATDRLAAAITRVATALEPCR